MNEQKPEIEINIYGGQVNGLIGKNTGQVNSSRSDPKKQTSSAKNFKVTEYLEAIKPNLSKQGCLDIRNEIDFQERTFNLVAKTASFKITISGIPMRGEAFFIFAYFPILNENSLRDFSTHCLNYAKHNVNHSTPWQSLFDFKAPANICFSTAITDQIDETTKKQIKETNPFGETVDLLWYNVPIIYTLNDSQLYFYQESLKSQPWEFFRGEVVWQELRKVVNQTLIKE